MSWCLTARQPLSRADLNLLRLLKGLSKDRIVVFVNKVDELEAIGERCRGDRFEDQGSFGQGTSPDHRSHHSRQCAVGQSCTFRQPG